MEAETRWSSKWRLRGGDGPGARRTRRLSAALVALATTFLFTVPAKADAHQVLGHWPLNEGSGQATADASAMGHTGTLGASSGPDSNDPTWIPGRFGQGLRFLGEENQFVGIARPQTLSPKLITVEAWIRRQGSPGQWRYIVSNGGQECHFASFGLYTAYTGGLAFYVSNGVKFIRSPTAPPARPGTEPGTTRWAPTTGSTCASTSMESRSPTAAPPS
jgi:hypothetical protein